MALFPASVEALIDQFARLPGVGRKNAQRFAFFMLDSTPEDVKAFAAALTEAREGVKRCNNCYNLTDSELCSICSSTSRDSSTVCVVAEPRDVAAIERCREFKGVYHVLHGVISPAKRKSPDDITVRELLERISNSKVQEVILATNPDTDGDTTALYIARLLKDSGILITRLAYGLPMGGHVEHADDVTILRALDGRRKL